MAVFTFDKVDEYVQDGDNNKINFLKLQDDGWYAKVRFMYGPGETFQGYSVHNVADDQSGRPKYVPCLREPGESFDVCPLCKAGNKVVAQYFLPVYVISIVSKENGKEKEEQINGVYLFQRGKTFQGALSSILRQCGGTPIVNNVFNIVRNGKAKDPQTTYLVEYVGRDNVGLNDLPARPEVLGSYILPNLNAEQMVEKYLNTDAIQPREARDNSVPSNLPKKFSF